MNEKLKNLITPQNILSYSRACVDVCETLMELKDENFKRLVIPSRGAYPFYKGALTSYGVLTKKGIERHDFWSHFDLCLLPYTADYEKSNIDTNSNSIRKFWSKILADTIRKESSPYTHFYNNLVDVAGKKLTLNPTNLKTDKFYNDNINDEKFIFLDTAISGRAICDIIESFHEFNLKDFFIIMITDSEGSELKSCYKNIIEKEKSLGRLKQINVKKIYSEDASPLLNTGISSIVFPSLMDRAYNEVAEFKNNQIVGAGLWFIDSASHLRMQNPKLNAVRGILFSLKNIGISINLGGKDTHFEELVKLELEDMIENLGDFNLDDGNSTKELIYNRIASKETKLEEEVEVSSSHIIRITLNADIITNLIKPLKYK
ncbi:hypothetical protein [Polaribacter vadi]|mgnify:CR=1 FL=1|uniref:hypothetical protein n=1 Tax=Polaribacter vadi TaxID=1774273 RepID=UPI0030ECAC2C|tara:strand:- start:52 stop:1176 length:1125 start_codon:yes stop_codon:yes gene_type:complete